MRHCTRARTGGGGWRAIALRSDCGPLGRSRYVRTWGGTVPTRPTWCVQGAVLLHVFLQLSAELEKAREAAQLLEGETRDLLKKVAHWEVKFSSGESELKELQFALQQQTAEKATIQQTHQLVRWTGLGGSDTALCERNNALLCRKCRN